MEWLCLLWTAGSKEGHASFKLLALIRQIKEEEGKETRECIRRKTRGSYLPRPVKMQVPNSQLVLKTLPEQREERACPGKSRMASLQ